MKKFLLSLLILLTVASVPASIEAKKKVRRTAKTEKYAYLNDVERKVQGKHMLSLQWLSWKYFGYVNITKQPDGTITCRGEQLARNCKDADNDCKTNDDYIKLDGVIDIVDATLIQKAAAGMGNLTAKQLKWCDFDFDGKITIADATLVQKIASGIYNYYL